MSALYGNTMRQARIRGEGLSYYHCLSRVVDRRFIFGDEEREFIVALMRKLEAFLGVRVVTYAVMSNHFHLLVEVPDRERLPPLDRDTLLRRLGLTGTGQFLQDFPLPITVQECTLWNHHETSTHPG